MTSNQLTTNQHWLSTNWWANHWIFSTLWEIFTLIKFHQRLHPWPLMTWPGHFSGPNTWLVHKNIVANSELASNGLQGYFVSEWKSPLALAPLTSRGLSRAFFLPKYLAGSLKDCQQIWFGQFWPEKCTVFMNQPSIGARKMPWSRQ